MSRIKWSEVAVRKTESSKSGSSSWNDICGKNVERDGRVNVKFVSEKITKK